MITLKQWNKNQADTLLWDKRYSGYLRQYQSLSLKGARAAKTPLSLQNIAPLSNVHTFLAYKGSVPVGFAIIGTGAECQCNCSFCVKAFCVFPEYRRLGIGTEMLKQLYARYAQITPYAACLQIAIENDDALDFWIKANRKLGHELRRDNACSLNLEYGDYITTG